MKRNLLAASMLVGLSSIAAHAQTAQDSAFTYQGNLTANGQPANGDFDLTFKLFDNPTVGAGNQVGSSQMLSQFPVVNGSFATDIAFPNAFSGNQLWLEVTVGTQTLSPRQPVNSVPVAQYALSGVSGPTGPIGATGATGHVSASSNVRAPAA
jgi:hypothetical protein